MSPGCEGSNLSPQPGSYRRERLNSPHPDPALRHVPGLASRNSSSQALLTEFAATDPTTPPTSHHRGTRRLQGLLPPWQAEGEAQQQANSISATHLSKTKLPTSALVAGSSNPTSFAFHARCSLQSVGCLGSSYSLQPRHPSEPLALRHPTSQLGGLDQHWRRRMNTILAADPKDLSAAINREVGSSRPT